MNHRLRILWLGRGTVKVSPVVRRSEYPVLSKNTQNVKNVQIEAQQTNRDIYLSEHYTDSRHGSVPYQTEPGAGSLSLGLHWDKLLLYVKEFWTFVAEGTGLLAAVLVLPATFAVGLQTHDGALAFVHLSGLPAGPVGFVEWFVIQPVPVSGQGAATRADPDPILAPASKVAADMSL